MARAVSRRTSARGGATAALAAAALVACAGPKELEVDARPAPRPTAANAAYSDNGEPAPIERPRPLAPVATSGAPAGPVGSVVAVSAGSAHTCALYQSGRVACWGDNGVGQAGGPPTRDAGSDPHWVALPARARQVVAGFFVTCALDDPGQIWCWGVFEAGTIRSGGAVAGSTALPDTPQLHAIGTPRPVVLAAGSGSVTRIALSLENPRACAVRGREVVCWKTGEVSDNPPFVMPELAVAEGERIVDLAVGAGRSCVIVEAAPSRPGETAGKRRIECWQSGAKPATADWPAGAEPIEITLGTLHLCARDAAATVACWRIGVAPGWWTKPATRIRHPNGKGWRSVSAGADFACAVDADGRVGCFLAEPEGLPDDVVATAWAAPRADARLVAGVEHASTVAAGAGHNVFGHGYACALSTSAPAGAIACWGDGESGQLGDGKRPASSAPVMAVVPR